MELAPFQIITDTLGLTGMADSWLIPFPPKVFDIAMGVFIFNIQNITLLPIPVIAQPPVLLALESYCNRETFPTIQDSIQME